MPLRIFCCPFNYDKRGILRSFYMRRWIEDISVAVLLLCFISLAMKRLYTHEVTRNDLIVSDGIYQHKRYHYLISNTSTCDDFSDHMLA